MGKLIGGAMLLAGCVSPPVARLSFTALDSADPCVAQESRWFTNLERVWVAARSGTETLESDCVEAPVAGWDGLAGKLDGAGDLLTVDREKPFSVYLLAVKEAGCPG